MKSDVLSVDCILLSKYRSRKRERIWSSQRKMGASSRPCSESLLICSFPKQDCCCLPLVHSSAEELARYLVRFCWEVWSVGGAAYWAHRQISFESRNVDGADIVGTRDFWDDDWSVGNWGSRSKVCFQYKVTRRYTTTIEYDTEYFVCYNKPTINFDFFVHYFSGCPATIV